MATGGTAPGREAWLKRRRFRRIARCGDSEISILELTDCLMVNHEFRCSFSSQKLSKSEQWLRLEKIVM